MWPHKFLVPHMCELSLHLSPARWALLAHFIEQEVTFRARYNSAPAENNIIYLVFSLFIDFRLLVIDKT